LDEVIGIRSPHYSLTEKLNGLCDAFLVIRFLLFVCEVEASF
jgi:hypothetical protein